MNIVIEKGRWGRGYDFEVSHCFSEGRNSLKNNVMLNRKEIMYSVCTRRVGKSIDKKIDLRTKFEQFSWEKKFKKLANVLRISNKRRHVRLVEILHKCGRKFSQPRGTLKSTSRLKGLLQDPTLDDIFFERNAISKSWISMSPDRVWTSGWFLRTRTVKARHQEVIRAKTDRLWRS